MSIRALIWFRISSAESIRSISLSLCAFSRRSRAVGLILAGLIALPISQRSDAREPLLVPPDEPREPLIVPEAGSPPPPAPGSESDRESGAYDALTWARLMRELSELLVPSDYEVRKDWGHTTEVLSGFHVRSNSNGLPRISKRTRLVNHGLWRRFHVQLLRPEERFRIELRNVHVAETGGLAGQIVITARLRCTAQAVVWNYGARGPETTVLTDLTLRAVSDWRLYLRNKDPQSWIPEFALVPEVHGLRLRILDFDVRRIGPIGGEVADKLGDASRGVVQELLKRQEPRLLRRLQRETGQLDLAEPPGEPE